MKLVLASLLSLTLGQNLPKLNINPGQIGVAGLSSGAAMAVQVHVSFSKSLIGVGVVAGPPYWCAEADLQKALTACENQPNLIDVGKLVSATNYAAGVDSIDPPENLKRARVFVFSGTKDTIVTSGVVQKTLQYYSTWVPSSQSTFVNSVPSEHSWVTDNFGSACGALQSPYMNNCSVDMSGQLLQFMYSNALKSRGKQVPSNLQMFDQAPYVPAPWSLKLLSMGTSGALYVPTACKGGSTACKLIVVFHGCNQGISVSGVGEDFVRNTGINEWAEVNNIVVLYPQTVISPVVPYNPQGCWDWWGYTGADYACKLGGQIATVRNMIHAITGFFDATNNTSVA